MTIEPTIRDIPLPGMPAPETLWAVHVEGPDDIIAESSRAQAETNAAALNAWYGARTKDVDFDPDTFPRIHAKVVEWPYERAAHAEALIRQQEEA